MLHQYPTGTRAGFSPALPGRWKRQNNNQRLRLRRTANSYYTPIAVIGVVMGPEMRFS